ncbi:uncharacterized protein LOC119114260 [Pollicipes pollicipes]|uniref:uncharacterized protein LOC119114260 n=1 Tax=Pollicipes pollicipes TaxID=41117 RepID=UPI001885737D|nr:uncharacterized protein LOC119114260 [Pollicipes pollicipes]
MELLRSQAEVLRPLAEQLQLLVGEDELTRTLVRLGLAEASPTGERTNHTPLAEQAANHTPLAERATNQTPLCEAGPQDDTPRLSLISAVTRPPLSRDSELARRCHRLFESGENTDLKFPVLGDSVLPSLLGTPSPAISEKQPTVLLAHAPVVAARSEWLRRALASGMRESIDKQISICDASPAIFRSMLEFLYCGHVTPENWPPEQLMELMVLADRYELDDLKHSCEALLETHIDEDSVFCLLSIAEQYNARKLKSSALEFVATNPEVVQTELFLELSPSLQAEVEETAVWAPPRAHLECDASHKRPRPAPASPGDSAEELVNLTRGIHLRETSRSSSSSQEESGPPAGGRLEACLQRLRSIVGEDVARAELIRVVLAADYDVNRALNFFFSA